MNSAIKMFDETLCALGEGIVWNPRRKSFIWFDILGSRLFEKKMEQKIARVHNFDILVSACGWVDDTKILVATANSLELFDLDNSRREVVIELEKDNLVTRSNDGRADPFGGFWIGTMGKNLESAAGAIYRYYRGELRKMYEPITVPNSMCFSTCGSKAYFSDTPQQLIWCVDLDPKGWPKSEPAIFIDMKKSNLLPDGAVIDSEGCLWNAQWGSNRVAKYSSEGTFLEYFEVPAVQVSCPGFGGVDGKTLMITTAREGTDPKKLEEYPFAGATFILETDTLGQEEYKVTL